MQQCSSRAARLGNDIARIVRRQANVENVLFRSESFTFITRCSARWKSLENLARAFALFHQYTLKH